MTEEKINAFIERISTSVLSWPIELTKVLREVPEPPRWIPCSERMPKGGEPIYVGATDASVYATSGGSGSYFGWTHWQPRIVPLPPVAEDTPLVTAIKEMPYNGSGQIYRKDVLALVEQMQGGAK